MTTLRTHGFVSNGKGRNLITACLMNTGKAKYMAATKTMTVSQALDEFLGRQWTVDGAHRERTIAGMFGIFGHGNVAGIGQALKQYNVDEPELMPYYQARNEQAMVHQSVGYARMHRRRGLVHQDRKSTRLNSSHVAISYAVFCLKK